MAEEVLFWCLYTECSLLSNILYNSLDVGQSSSFIHV